MATFLEKSSQRVLVVDDQQAITDLVSTVMRYEGFDVEVAATGRAALDSVSSFRPDLIVLDVQLADLDGFAVQQRLSAERWRCPLDHRPTIWPYRLRCRRVWRHA